MYEILLQLFPKPEIILIITPITLICILSFLFLSGILKIRYEIKTNYTRKLFHILVFTLAGVFGFFYNHTAVMFYGGITGLIVIFTIIKGDGFVLYEGIAREQDIPHRSFYIGIPFISTAFGGLFNSYLFGQFAIVGYFVAGWGDAVGEPIGIRFGKHKYNVPSLRNVRCQRSVEGSIAIAIMSSIAIFIALFFIGGIELFVLIPLSIIIGSITAIIEALSPHGIDNFTTQVIATGLSYSFLNLL